MVRVLLSHPNIDVDYKDLSGVSALWAASENNHFEVMELLLNPPTLIGADPNLPKSDGSTPLWVASAKGNTQCMQLLIIYGADVNLCTKQGATPLFVAAQNGRKEAVDMLLTANANMDLPRDDGTTPLMMSVHKGHIEIVRLLLNSGADPTLSNNHNLSALGCAAMSENPDIFEILYQAVVNVMDPEAVAEFVNAGDSEKGMTPFHLACIEGHENVIKYLIEKVKVDIFKKDFENRTGIDHACQNGHGTIVPWLMSHYGRSRGSFDLNA